MRRTGRLGLDIDESKTFDELRDAIKNLEARLSVIELFKDVIGG